MHEDMPPLPTPEEWCLLQGLLKVLENIGAATRVLQTYAALAAMVLPVFDDLTQVLFESSTMREHDGVIRDISACFLWDVQDEECTC